MLNRFLTLQRRNPYPLYWVLRRVQPVVHIARYDLWFATRYDDVKKVLSDYEHYSSDFRRAFRPGEELDQSSKISLIGSDPPVHTKLRGLMTKAFTPKAVASLENRIGELTHELIDGVADAGRMDLVQDLAYPLPVMVIAEMLGVPAADRDQFKIWSDAIVRSADDLFSSTEDQQGNREGADAPLGGGEMGAYFSEIIAQRRASPQNDLISGLVAAELDGQKLSEWDLLDFCGLLLVAGNVTTTNLISNAVMLFLEHPDALEAVRADSTLLPDAIEEVLRFRSPVQFMFRVSSAETELGGRVVPPDQRVIALIGSANRDESVFEHANRFDITRKPNRHIAFGQGVHYCLGAPLARLEAKVVLPILLERLPNLARATSGGLPPTDGVLLHGVKNLPVRWDVRPRMVAV
jgi:cytochrome P450